MARLVMGITLQQHAPRPRHRREEHASLLVPAPLPPEASRW